MASADEEYTPEVKGVEDPSEYKQRHRIQSMLEARDRVLEQRRKAHDLLLKGEISKSLSDRIIRNSVEEYILESENKIKHYLPDQDPSEADEEIDEQDRLAWHIWFEASLGEIDMVTRTHEFEGLLSFIDAPENFRETWEEQSKTQIQGNKTIQKSAEYQIPEDVSMNSYRLLNTFWHEMGMDIEMKHKLPTDNL